jgi:thiol-disulfide isomerase/thioredoxin
MAGNRWIESIRWIIFAVDSFFQSHPRMALAIRITLFCLVYILVGHIQLFFYGGEAVDQQVRAPANYLPRLFHDKSSVIDLHDGNLNAMNRIIANNHLTVVLFYARWCPFSQRLARRYEKLASLLKDEVAMVAIDCWLSDGECRKSTISITYPVLIAHMLDQQILYHGGWREDEILAFVKRLLHPLQHLSSKEAYSTALLNHNVCVCVCVCVYSY